MQIFHLLNKIKWSKKENPNDYIIYYFDRILKENLKIPYSIIKEIQKDYILIKKNNTESIIPIHRIRKVLKRGKLIWER